MREALQDLRALKKLEKLSSRADVLKLIHCGLDHQLTMENYPHSSGWLLDLRERVNRNIQTAACR